MISSDHLYPKVKPINAIIGTEIMIAVDNLLDEIRSTISAIIANESEEIIKVIGRTILAETQRTVIASDEAIISLPNPKLLCRRIYIVSIAATKRYAEKAIFLLPKSPQPAML